MFRNREEAGKRLAEELVGLFDENPDMAPPVVLALPRGGVPVAYEIARRLKAPMDLVMVRKIGAPMQPELAAGAVVDGEDPVVVLNDEVVSQAGISEAEIEQRKKRELKEIEQRRAKYLAGREPLSVKGRTAIVVDDGIATGATMRAAVRAMRKRGPEQVIMAVPVGPRESLDRFAREVDRLVCLEAPAMFWAVGAYYQDFGQTSDEDVSRLMAEAEGFGKV
jgi:putative phosphoribosyl transferase